MKKTVSHSLVLPVFVFLVLAASFADRNCLGKTLEENRINIIAEYFSNKGISAVTSTLCHDTDDSVQLCRLLSKKGIKFNHVSTRNFNEFAVVEILSHRLGLVVDLKCEGAMEMLETASRQDKFIFENYPGVWLILLRERVSPSTLQEAVKDYLPHGLDPMTFLMEQYDIKKMERQLLDLNVRFNHEFFEQYNRSETFIRPETGKKKTEHPRGEEKEEEDEENDDEESSEIKRILRLKLLIDNRVTLAVPVSSGVYALYSIYKATMEGKPVISNIGQISVNNHCRVRITEKAEEKRHFHGTWLRLGSTSFEPDKFISLDDLTKRETDLWPKISYEHIRLLARDLNFRIVMRFFNDYGWLSNGSFTHLMGSFEKKKSLLSATAGLMRPERLQVADYTICPFRLSIGILFREPSLPSVSNIFILPFSRGIWISVGCLIVLIIFILRIRPMASKRWFPNLDTHDSDFSEISVYILGAICQQGFSRTPKSIYDRIIVLFLLVISLVLFSLYSACIVALLQSSSTAISSIKDLSESNFEVGLQAHFPFFDVLMKEATNPIVTKFYSKKVQNKHGKTHFSVQEGIEKMRTNLFAFQVELNAGYKFMSQTYLDKEKCGVKIVEVIPIPYIGFPIAKKSSFKKILRKRLQWQQEIGLFDRSWKLWVDQKPKCEVNNIGFISVGMTEFLPVLSIFFYGVFVSLIVFFIEILLTNKYFAESVKSICKVKVPTRSRA